MDESESLATITMLNDATDEFIAQELRSHALQGTEYAKLVRIEAAFRNMR